MFAQGGQHSSSAPRPMCAASAGSRLLPCTPPVSSLVPTPPPRPERELGEGPRRRRWAPPAEAEPHFAEFSEFAEPPPATAQGPRPPPSPGGTPMAPGAPMRVPRRGTAARDETNDERPPLAPLPSNGADLNFRDTYARRPLFRPHADHTVGSPRWARVCSKRRRALSPGRFRRRDAHGIRREAQEALEQAGHETRGYSGRPGPQARQSLQGALEPLSPDVSDPDGCRPRRLSFRPGL